MGRRGRGGRGGRVCSAGAGACSLPWEEDFEGFFEEVFPPLEAASGSLVPVESSDPEEPE